MKTNEKAWLALPAALLLVSVGCGGLVVPGDTDTGAAPDPTGAEIQPHEDVAPRRVVAETGVGEKGRYESRDPVSTAVRARFRAEQSIEFARVQQALQLYKATSRDGKGPPSHDVFMEKVIRENGIRLPELPPGEQYVFDPADQTLYVERPGAR